MVDGASVPDVPSASDRGLSFLWPRLLDLCFLGGSLNRAEWSRKIT